MTDTNPLPGPGGDFLRDKADIPAEFQRLDHGILVKIRDRRLGAVFLDRQDTRHIGSRDSLGREVVVLEPAPEEVEVLYRQSCYGAQTDLR